MIGMRNLLTLLCSFLSLAAFTLSAPGTPNLSPKLGSLAFGEVSRELSSPVDTEKRAIQVGPPQILNAVRYVAVFYDLSGNIRILLPTIVTQELLGLVNGGQVQSILEAVFNGFLTNPFLTSIPFWQLMQQSGWYADLAQAQLSTLGAVVNLCIDMNILPYIRSYNTYLYPGEPGMGNEMMSFLQHYIWPYWAGSPSAGLVSLDPRGVNVETLLVPVAKEVASAAMTYVYNIVTPPGTPSQKTYTTVHSNLTFADNSTQAAKLKLTNSTGHLDANLTKRATITCSDFYPNLLPFMQSGPMTNVGTNTISCVA